MPEWMRAVSQRVFGGPEVLEVVQARRPEPGPGEVLVRVSAARDMTASIASHTSATRGSSSGPPQPSEANNASTATASLAADFASFGCLRTFSLLEAFCALFTSSVAISRSSSSRASSTDLPSRCRTVASSVASRRPSG